eukprot:g14048.t1
MVTGEKKEEFRKYKTHWTEMFVEKADREQGNELAFKPPYFEAEFKRIRKVVEPVERRYTNGLRVHMPKGPKYIVELGPVIQSSIRNYNPRLSYAANKARRKGTATEKN